MADKSEESQVPVGFKFQPEDKEIIMYYLLKKVRGESLPWNGIRDFDLYGEHPPWENCRSEGKPFYVFTQLKKAGKKRVSRTVGYGGTWHGQDSGVKIYDDDDDETGRQNLIGLKKLFCFKAKVSSASSSYWIMHEYSLAGVSLTGDETNGTAANYVLCKIEGKKNKKGTQCTLKRKPSEDINPNSKRRKSNIEVLPTGSCEEASSTVHTSSLSSSPSTATFEIDHILREFYSEIESDDLVQVSLSAPPLSWGFGSINDASEEYIYCTDLAMDERDESAEFLGFSCSCEEQNPQVDQVRDVPSLPVPSWVSDILGDQDPMENYLLDSISV